MLEHQDFWLEIIKVIPAYLWVIGAFSAFLLAYDLYSRQLLLSAYAKQQQERLADLSQVERALDDVLTVAARNPHWHIEVSAADKAQVLRRLQGNGEMLSGCRVLWLDDRPDTLVNEIRLLQYLGLDVITVTSVGEALGHLKQTSCELLVSDIARPEGQSNGIASLQTLHDHYPALPAIFYVGNFNVQDGVPAGAFGITNRPDELLHLILDIMGRKCL